jgi:hypothetical protein
MEHGGAQCAAYAGGSAELRFTHSTWYMATRH